MAKRSKSLIFKAREDKARREREEYERLAEAREEATSDEEREAADLALTEYYEKREQEGEKRNQLKEAKAAARAAKMEAGRSVRGRQITWVDGGRDMVPGLSKKGNEFFVAAEGNLAKCNRDIGRWDTDSPYDNARGVKRGEILMIISENYEGNSGKQVVDVMVGADIIRGVPALALRPLE